MKRRSSVDHSLIPKKSSKPSHENDNSTTLSRSNDVERDKETAGHSNPASIATVSSNQLLSNSQNSEESSSGGSNESGESVNSDGSGESTKSAKSDGSNESDKSDGSKSSTKSDGSLASCESNGSYPSSSSNVSVGSCYDSASERDKHITIDESTPELNPSSPVLKPGNPQVSHIRGHRARCKSASSISNLFSVLASKIFVDKIGAQFANTNDFSHPGLTRNLSSTSTSSHSNRNEASYPSTSEQSSPAGLPSSVSINTPHEDHNQNASVIDMRLIQTSQATSSDALRNSIPSTSNLRRPRAITNRQDSSSSEDNPPLTTFSVYQRPRQLNSKLRSTIGISSARTRPDGVAIIPRRRSQSESVIER